MAAEITPSEFIDYYCERAQIAWECLHQTVAGVSSRGASGEALYVLQSASPTSWQTELIKAIPTALIAAIAAYVAWRQYRVARNKLKLDLFERRYAIFEEVWGILSRIVHHDALDMNHGLATPFNNLLPKAGFLFGKDVEDYLNEVVRRWAELSGLHRVRMARAQEMSQAQTARALELETWFFEQASSGAKMIFGRYLNFDGWK
jgi:hypothetical protein